MRLNRLVVAAAMAMLTQYAAAADSQSTLVYDAAYFAESRPNTAYDMIGRLPGFTFTDVGSARGFAGNAGNVLINGERPTSKADSLQSVLQRIPSVDVERIELIRGGAPGIDMQGLTVVANVILRRVDSTHVVLTAEDLVFTDGHMIPFTSAEFTRHDGDRIYEGTIAVVNNYDDSVGIGRHDVFDASGNLIEHDRAQSHGLGIGVEAKGAATTPLFGGEAKANMILRDSPFISTLEYTSPTLDQLFVDKSRNNTAELGLHWKGPIGHTELETLALQRLRRSTDISTADDTVTLQDFRSRATTGESIARATLRYLPSSDLTFEGGIEGAFNFLDGKTAFSVSGVPVVLPSASAYVDELRGEVFAQGIWKFADEWVFEAGARAEASQISESGDTRQDRSFFYPKPRAVLTWSPDSKTQLRLRYERVVGQLDFNNFIASSNLSATGVTAGNANLRPDQRTQYEFSAERHFWDKGAVVVTLLHEQIKDAVDFVPVHTDTSVFDAPGNIGNGRNDEVNVSLTLPLDGIGITNGLLRTTSIFRFSDVRDPTTGIHRVISAERPQDIEVRFSQDIASLSSTWGLFYFNAWTEDSFRLEQTRIRRAIPPYLSVYWDYKPSPAWSFHFEVDDALRFIYDDIRHNFAGPRNTSPLLNTDEYRTRSIPQIDFQIRYTFD
jgi:outer membrane receptor protein involved in Fe transport